MTSKGNNNSRYRFVQDPGKQQTKLTTERGTAGGALAPTATSATTTLAAIHSGLDHGESSCTHIFREKHEFVQRQG
jgi:hypothetical protein